jgi:adenylate kinase family enzyme
LETTVTPDRFPHRRISVVGTSASGKSTLARALAETLGLSYVELDALHWEADWTEAPDEVFRARVTTVVSGEAWVVDGNYAVARDLVWGRAEAVVWLDPALPVILRQYVERTWRRARSREELWPGTGNRERLTHLVSRDGLLWWILSTHLDRRRRYAALLAERPKLAVVRLRSMAAADRWLGQLTSG